MTFTRNTLRLSLAGGLMLVLAACSGTARSIPATSAPLGDGRAAAAVLQALLPGRGATLPGLQHQARTGKGWLSPAAHHRTPGQVFVASALSSVGGDVFIYSTKGQGQQPIGDIQNGIASPNGIDVDAQGNLYVANGGSNTVTVYPPGQLSATVTYTAGVSTPEAVAVASDGTVYISNETGSSSFTGSISVYTSGSTTPTATITLPGEYAFGAAVDKANNLYVAWFNLSAFTVSVYEYAPGSTSGTNLNLDLPPSIFPAFDLTFDHAGDLVLAAQSLDHNPPKYIEAFPPGQTEPSHKLNEAGLLDVVNGMAFSKNGRFLYVAAENDHLWMELTYPHAIPRDAVNVGVPTGLRLSPGT